jgi:hypothetical protein
VEPEPEQKSEPYGAALFLYGPEQDFDVAPGAPTAPALASFLITSISDYALHNLHKMATLTRYNLIFLFIG